MLDEEKIDNGADAKDAHEDRIDQMAHVTEKAIKSNLQSNHQTNLFSTMAKN